MSLIVAIASDHAGVELKALIIQHLNSRMAAHVDLGPFTVDVSVDYPDYAHRLCTYLTAPANPASVSYRGILICGTGIGMSMVANRYKDIRCAVVDRKSISEITRMHNDTNVIALGARVIKPEDAPGIVDTFLDTPFEGGRHAARLMKFGQLEAS